MSITLSNKSQILIDGPLYIGQITGWDLNRTTLQVDTTGFNDTMRQFTNIGLVDGDLNIEAQFDDADVGQEGLIDALSSATPLSISVWPDGTGIGKPKYIITLAVASYSVAAGSVDDAISVSFSGKILSFL